MVKPDGVQRNLVGEVISRMEKRGLKILALKMYTIPEETARAHYAEHEGKPFFQSLLDFITSGPSVSIVVQGKNAVSEFGLDTGRNIVHASDSTESANREISIHFSESEISQYLRIDEQWLYE
jgi:nucleoside-diphosphate kinase